MASSNSSSSAAGLGCLASVVVFVLLVIAAINGGEKRKLSLEPSFSSPSVRIKEGAPNNIQFNLENPTLLISLNPVSKKITLHKDAVKNGNVNPSFHTSIDVYLHVEKPSSKTQEQKKGAEPSDGALLASFDIGPIKKGASAPSSSKTKDINNPPNSKQDTWISLKLEAKGENGDPPDINPDEIIAPYSFTSLEWKPHSDRTHFKRSIEFSWWCKGLALLVLAMIGAGFICSYWPQISFKKCDLSFFLSFSFLSLPLVIFSLFVLVLFSVLAQWNGWDSGWMIYLANWPIFLGRAITHLSSFVLLSFKASSTTFTISFAIVGALMAGGTGLLWGRFHYNADHPQSLWLYRRIGLGFLLVALLGIGTSMTISKVQLQGQMPSTVEKPMANNAPQEIRFTTLAKASPISDETTGTKEIETTNFSKESQPLRPDFTSSKPIRETSDSLLKLQPPPKMLITPPEVGSPNLLSVADLMPTKNANQSLSNGKSLDKTEPFYGIGVTPVISSGRGGTEVSVKQVAPGGAAALAGILPNDSIVSIDGESVAAMTEEKVIKSLRSDHESAVTLRIVRNGQPWEFPLYRSRVSIDEGGDAVVMRPQNYQRGYLWRDSPLSHRIRPGETNLTVRSGPGSEFALLGTLFQPNSFKVVGGAEQSSDGGTWVPVKAAQVQGWVNRAFIRKIEYDAPPETFVIPPWH